MGGGASTDGWTNIKHYANVNDQRMLLWRHGGAGWEGQSDCRFLVNAFKVVFFFSFSFFLSDEEQLNGGKKPVILYRHFVF